MATEPLTAGELDAIEARANAATRGPWVAASDLPNYAVWAKEAKRDVVHSPSRVAVNNPWNEWTRENDADFIAAARTDVPRLVAEVRRLSAVADAAVLSLQEPANYEHRATMRAALRAAGRLK